jgi:hypothetical protein
VEIEPNLAASYFDAEVELICSWQCGMPHRHLVVAIVYSMLCENYLRTQLLSSLVRDRAHAARVFMPSTS